MGRVDDLLELTAIWRDLGLSVKGLSGWQDRGYSGNTFEVFGVHHTAATVDVDAMLVAGRSTVPGPLANIGNHANGDVVIVAAGKANHFGEATWPNNRSMGLEITGPIPLTASGAGAFSDNYRSAVLLAAGFCIWKNKDPFTVVRSDVSPLVRLVAAHKEVAVPFGRKVDPAFDMTAFRNAVREVYKNGVEDMTPEQAQQLADVAAKVERIENVLFNGHARQPIPIDNLYSDAREIRDALIVPGTTSAEDAVNIAFSRIRGIAKMTGAEASDTTEDLFEALARTEASILARLNELHPPEPPAT